MRFRFLCLVFALLSLNAWAQPDVAQKSSEYKNAIALLRQQDYQKALKPLNKLCQKFPDFAEGFSLWVQTARLAADTAQIMQSLTAYNSKFRNDLYRLLLAEAYLDKGNYNQMCSTLNQLKQYPNIKPAIAAEMLRLNNTCTYILSNPPNNHVKIIPNELPSQINRYRVQYFPTLSADQKFMVFTARETRGTNWDENLVFSEFKDGQWTVAAEITGNINSAYAEGTPTLNAAGNFMVFASDNQNVTYGQIDLVSTTRNGTQFSQPINLGPTINSPNVETQPSLSADGNFLFFVSDRPGGYGSKDIYYSKLTHKGWSKARNAGPNINTPFDDIAPFVHPNGNILFFSSEGWPGYGQLDLFAIDWINDTTFDNRRNLGPEINTYQSEASMTVSADGLTAYISKHWGNYDKIAQSRIYSFPLPATSLVAAQSDVLRIRVANKSTQQPIEATIEQTNLDGNRINNQFLFNPQGPDVLVSVSRAKATGIFVSAKGYLPVSLSPEQIPDTIGNHIFWVYLENEEKGSKMKLNNIHFESGSYKLMPTAKPDLERLLTFLLQNPKTKVTICGHTDDVGTTSDNQTLSEQRALAVKQWLTTADPNLKLRITTEGRGESVPAVVGTHKAARAANRRIEVEITQM